MTALKLGTLCPTARGELVPVYVNTQTRAVLATILPLPPVSYRFLMELALYFFPQQPLHPLWA